MILTIVFGVNQDIIKVNGKRNIKFFYKSFVNIATKANKRVEKIKTYDLILEIAIPYIKSCFLLVTFPNSYSIICIC